MKEESVPKPSKLGETAQFTAVTSGIELLLVFGGLGSLGAAYTSGRYLLFVLLLVLLAVPIALYLARDWIAARLKEPD
jgi:hypothetical protein